MFKCFFSDDKECITKEDFELFQRDVCGILNTMDEKIDACFQKYDTINSSLDLDKSRLSQFEQSILKRVNAFEAYIKGIEADNKKIISSLKRQLKKCKDKE